MRFCDLADVPNHVYGYRLLRHDELSCVLIIIRWCPVGTILHIQNSSQLDYCCNVIAPFPISYFYII